MLETLVVMKVRARRKVRTETEEIKKKSKIRKMLVQKVAKIDYEDASVLYDSIPPLLKTEQCQTHIIVRDQ